ncbi:MAG: hypothetical protein Q8N61_00525 [bacterium]|nr:hypothetical protein [bacterium]
MGERIWNKFHPLYGPDLKVGLETTFRKDVVLDLDPLYGKSGLIHDSAKESVQRVYEPAVKVLGSCKDGKAVQIFFEPVSSASSLFQRLVFTRKFNPTQKPRCWTVAARHGEVSHFGFDSWNSKDQRYLSLAYPGISGQFIPVYVKIQNGKEGFVYLEVWAWEEDGEVVIQARRVENADVPESLISTNP